MLRRAEIVVVGLALALVVLGISVRVALAPLVTSTLVEATGGVTNSGLDAVTAEQLAQEIRGYVTGTNEGPLPAQVGAREGFSADAVSHLDDVRGVITASGWATLVLSAALGAWCIWRWKTSQRTSVAQVMRAGAVWIVVGIPVAAVLAMTDFDRFFAGFHGLFFESGTWQFPAGDLLIQLFPEPFWMSAAVLVAALSLAGAVALTLFSRVIGNDRVHDA